MTVGLADTRGVKGEDLHDAAVSPGQVRGTSFGP
jgi:hypothetical protein